MNKLDIRIKATLVGVVLLVTMSVGGVFVYNKISSNLDQRYSEFHRELYDMEWKFITSILEENRQKSYLISKSLAMNIEKELILWYPDLGILKTEFETQSRLTSTKSAEIFAKNIKDVYLNIDNDNNDPWVGYKNGILSDLSLNCATVDIRSWESEYSLHFNPELAKVAVSKVINRSQDLIFWEFVKPENKEHKTITSMTLTDLKDIYYTEGINGLKTYEFLCPYYITTSGDIFGVEDVSVSGIKQENYKLIVSQNFNLYEQILYSHESVIENYNYQHNSLNRVYKSEKNLYELCAIIYFLIIAIVILITMSTYNCLYAISERVIIKK